MRLKSCSLQEVKTCDPTYYNWTQWLFLQLHKHGYVAYQLAHVNWDPVDKTVLADEQVRMLLELQFLRSSSSVQIDSEGRSWRSGVIVEKKLLRQWVIKTTRLAKVLASSLLKSNHANF